ncbi:MAG: dipeptidase [Gammaproteobacteria bacterium]|jgi:membrane dipeptidase|nr:dipeptidase [Gammaproteobacteria bacterium]
MKKQFLILVFIFTSCVSFGATEDELMTRAQAIHDRVMALDTHVDIPLNFATSEHDPLDAEAQVNLLSMRSGGLDTAFFIVYVGQEERNEMNYLDAKADALSKFDAIHRMVELYPDEIGFAFTADEANALHSDGKLVAMIGVENGFSIGQDISLIEEFRNRGARYMGLVHNGHNDIGDSAQAQERLNDVSEEHGGLSEYGYQVVEELNRVGILVDISHVSKKTMLDAASHSQAPIIASHSSVDGIFAHLRNLDDEQLLAIRDNGGVVQVVAFDGYVNEGMGTASVSEFVDHIDYVVDLIGVGHVGISSDFGGGGGIPGWNNADETINVTLELVRRGYTEEEISMIWSGNVLRILREAEDVSASLNIAANDESNQSTFPNFANYTVEQSEEVLSTIDFSSHPDASNFRTRLEYKLGETANFAGQLTGI